MIGPLVRFAFASEARAAIEDAMIAVIDQRVQAAQRETHEMLGALSDNVTQLQEQGRWGCQNAGGLERGQRVLDLKKNP